MEAARALPRPARVRTRCRRGVRGRAVGWRRRLARDVSGASRGACAAPRRTPPPRATRRRRGPSASGPVETNSPHSLSLSLSQGLKRGGCATRVGTRARPGASFLKTTSQALFRDSNTVSVEKNHSRSTRGERGKLVRRDFMRRRRACVWERRGCGRLDSARSRARGRARGGCDPTHSISICNFLPWNSGTFRSDRFGYDPSFQRTRARVL